MNTNSPVRANHPLLELRPERIDDWPEWLERWNTTTRLDQHLGLLHCGFDVPAVAANFRSYEQSEVRRLTSERLCFYLELADGHWGDASDFLMVEPDCPNSGCLSLAEVGGTGFLLMQGHHHCQRRAKMRAELSRKAFAVLSQKYFRWAASDEASTPEQLQEKLTQFFQPEVIRKLVWFLRIDEHPESANAPVPNLRRGSYTANKHPVELAREFTLRLCQLGWLRRLNYVAPAIKEQLVASRSDFISLLDGIGQIDVLLDFDRYDLDSNCYKRLQKLALRPRRMQYRVRQPESVQEAAAYGSKPAQILLLHQSLQSEINSMNLRGLLT